MITRPQLRHLRQEREQDGVKRRRRLEIGKVADAGQADVTGAGNFSRHSLDPGWRREQVVLAGKTENRDPDCRKTGPIDPTDTGGMERAFAAFAQWPNGGVIVTGSQPAIAHRELIISLLMRYRLPNVYPFRYYSANGALASYGPDSIENYTRAAAYVDRILKGAVPADLPVQAPDKI